MILSCTQHSKTSVISCDQDTDILDTTDDLKSCIRCTQSNHQILQHASDELSTKSETNSAQVDSKDSATSIIPNNMFSRLHLFFNSKVDCFIIPDILEDLIIRKKYSLDVILCHLEEFQTDQDQGLDSRNGSVSRDDQLSGKLFTYLVGKVFNGALSHMIHTHHIRSLASLVINHKDCFEDLLSDLCRTEYNSAANRMLVLEQCLFEINGGRSSALQTIDQRLSCGETPLKLSVRFRSERVLLLLLQHGASIHNRWLCFNSAFEVLLFSPHHVYTSPCEIEKIVKCLELLLRVSDHVKIAKEDNARHNELVPFIPNWRDMIPLDRISSPCTLKHKCRLQIRNVLRICKNLPKGICTLPLPNILKSYLDLVHS